MKFGQSTSHQELENTRFELPWPRLHPSLKTLPLNRGSNQQSDPLSGVGYPQAQIYLGAPVWAKKEWIGQIYPSGTAPKDFLNAYARKCNSIELNASFHQIPDPKTVSSWRSQVHSEFRFSPKFYNGISRFEVLTEIPQLTRRFVFSMQHFEETLGMSFLQLPPSFSPSKILILKKFFKILPKDFLLSVEFRHPAWFSGQQLIPNAFELLGEHQVGTVVTDTPAQREVIHFSITRDTMFVRFLGNRLHASDSLRINLWLERLIPLLGGPIKTVYFYIHQPDEIGIFPLINQVALNLNGRFNLGLKEIDAESLEEQTSFSF